MPIKQTDRLRRTVVVLTTAQVARLDAEAQQSIENRSRLVRQAIEEFLNRRETAKRMEQEAAA